MSIVEQPSFLRGLMIEAFTELGSKPPPAQQQHIKNKLGEAIRPLLADLQPGNFPVVYAITAMLTAMAFLEHGDLALAALELRRTAPGASASEQPSTTTQQ